MFMKYKTAVEELRTSFFSVWCIYFDYLNLLHCGPRFVGLTMVSLLS